MPPSNEDAVLAFAVPFRRVGQVISASKKRYDLMKPPVFYDPAFKVDRLVFWEGNRLTSHYPKY
jgi:hypothetical protein